MPILSSTYKTAFYLLNGHMETIFPYLLRPVKSVNYARERLVLPDGDFLDLDWLVGGHKRLAILCHGLEGSSDSQYMKGMASVLHGKAWDVLAINFRSCSGEMNRRLRMYHHGEIEDLTTVVQHLIELGKYDALSLCGFSLGGNVILKYLGVLSSEVPLPVRSAVAISVPCDLASSSKALDRWSSYLYTRRFRRSLKEKFEAKNQQYPGTFDLENYHKVGSWHAFDSKYTTALTPFETAEEYYEQGSANNFLDGIRTSTLIINALNDPFLMRKSYPKDACEYHDFVYLETPKYGGHVGFWYPGLSQSYIESRAIEFMNQHV